MKSKLFLATCILLTALSAQAAPPIATQATTRAVTFSGCHFTLKDPYRARLSVDSESSVHSASYIATINPKATRPFETWIQFNCDPASSKTYLDSASIKLTDNGWTVDLSKEDPRFPSPHTTLYLIRGKSWVGAGTTQDATDGDEERRTRTFGFCIPHGTRALCGMVRHVGYLDHLSESILPQVIKLLESIEFIDTPPSRPSEASSASPPAQ